jgi:ATP-dependent Clp protease ATP-binding subunit ClpA
MPPFDEAASAALALAQADAGRRGHASVGTEHLLLALTDDTGTDACSILDALGTSCTAVRTDVGELITDRHRTDRPLHLTPRARVALDIAMRCAGRLGADATSPRHLLYGLAAEREGIAAKVLWIHGATPAAVDRFLVPLPAG